MAKAKIQDIVNELLSDYLSENGYELYHVDFSKEGKERYLSVFIDKMNPDGSYGFVDTDDCEKVSRYLSERLDERDPIEQNYFLVVSSPGLDRTLYEEKDFIRFVGHDVDVSLYKALEGYKNITGKLISYENGMLRIAAELPKKKGKAPEKKELDIPKELTAQVKLAVIF